MRGRKDTFAPADCGGERPRRPRGSDAFESESTRTARLLGVLISTDLTFDVSQRPVLLPAAGGSGSSVRQSPESTTTLIRAFVSSRVDYCCSLLIAVIGSPRSVTDKLQRIVNAAGHAITNTKKYESGLSRILHHDLHWLDVTERIQFRVATTVGLYQCLHGMAPAYLTELCASVTASASHRGGLRSDTTSNLVVPRCRLSTYGTRAFSVAGPVCWNALPDYLKSSDLYRSMFINTSLKHFYFVDTDTWCLPDSPKPDSPKLGLGLGLAFRRIGTEP